MSVRIRTIITLSIAIYMFLSLIGLAHAHLLDIQGHWAEQQISDWSDKGFVTGYPDETFGPDNIITRAEFITLVNKSFGFYEKAQVTFSDVSYTDWFYTEVAKAKAAGYITGYEDDTIRPDNAISRQEVAAIIFRLLDMKATNNSDALSNMEDMDDISGWAKPIVFAVTEKNLMKGYPDQTFRPLNFTSRAEALVSLDRAFWSKYPVIITGSR